MIHEYVHYLQSENKNSVYGSIYKKTKNKVKKELTQEMDRLIAVVTKLEKAGKKAELAAEVKKFVTISGFMQKFAPWQDLIDEREIFLLYLERGGEFGADRKDLELARKNMGFICHSKSWNGVLPTEQCTVN